MQTITVDLQKPISLTKDIKITLTSVRGNVIALGITAPRNVHILRTELKKDETLRKQHINRENISA
jgi:carbon storage regulator CsrA